MWVRFTLTRLSRATLLLLASRPPVAGNVRRVLPTDLHVMTALPHRPRLAAHDRENRNPRGYCRQPDTNANHLFAPSRIALEECEFACGLRVFLGSRIGADPIHHHR